MASLLLSPKLGILSFSVLCIAMVLKLSLPAVTEFAYSELPSIWTVVMTWLRPPYLYLVINGIIITLVASSKLHPHKVIIDSPPEILAVTPMPMALVYAEVDGYPKTEYAISSDAELVEVYKDVLPEVVEKRMVMTRHHDEAREKLSEANSVDERIRDDELAVPESQRAPKSEDLSVSLYKQPPILEGGRALRASKPKRQETLEATWQTITDGHPMLTTRDLDKSATGCRHLHQDPDPVMTKSETIHDSDDRHISVRELKKEPSLSQDELNRKVEAFINKSHEDMRLQRLKSLNQQ